MLLKPFSVLSGTDYKDFLLQNYFCRIDGSGIKKINLKGLNSIGAANDPDFKQISEDDITSRKIEDQNIYSPLISKHEQKTVSEMTKSLFDSCKNESLSFSSVAASFSIELLDIIIVEEMKAKDLSKGIEVIKDSMIFAEKEDAFGCFVSSLEKYQKYLEKPSVFSLLQETEQSLKSCIEKYEANPYAHFLLGLIYHRPTALFNINKSIQEFLLSKKYSSEIEDQYMEAISDFLLSWLNYVTGETEKAIEFLSSATDEEFMRIPEVYYNTAKFYALKNDADNALKYLEEAITRFDHLYSVKAAVDDDFNSIRKELNLFFDKLRDEEKERVLQQMDETGIEIISSKKK